MSNGRADPKTIFKLKNKLIDAVNDYGRSNPTLDVSEAVSAPIVAVGTIITGLDDPLRRQMFVADYAELAAKIWTEADKFAAFENGKLRKLEAAA